MGIWRTAEWPGGAVVKTPQFGGKVDNRGNYIIYSILPGFATLGRSNAQV